MTAPFSRLLDVQDHDTAIDQLRHRRDHMPEKAELRAVEAERRTLNDRLAAVRAQRDEVVSRQTTLEGEVAASEQRIMAIDKRMFSGQVSASRDLQAMQGEIDSLKARISSLEDRELEVMEEREPLDASVADREAAMATLDERAAALQSVIDATEAEIDIELASKTAERQTLAVDLPAELAENYERLRARLGGVGAAKLDHGTCMGCHLRLPAVEADRLRKLPPDALVFCDQCGRILVRE